MSRVFAVLATCLAVLAARPAAAANIVVETDQDGVTGPLCDIRDAIRAAEDDQVTGGCVETDPSGADVVDLTQLAGSIDLSQGVLPTFHSNVTLLGPGANVLAIDGLDASAIVDVGSGAVVTIVGLTIRNGASGGRGSCVHVDAGTLLMADSRVTGCDSIDGGAIAVDAGGFAQLDRVLVDANTAGNSGAGLVNGESTVWIANSTFSGNVATQVGGAIATFGHDGGGVATATRIHSSTLVDNGAGTGGSNLWSADGDPLVDTFLTHVLVGNPRTGTNCGGAAVTSLGWNLSSDASCALAATGDRPSTPTDVATTLGDNGGPTATHALLPGSAAIDGGNPAGCTDASGAVIALDQRGFPRRLNGNGDATIECDIGAYEAVPEPVALAAGAVGWLALAARARGRRTG